MVHKNICLLPQLHSSYNTDTYILVYLLNWCTDMPAQNSSFPQHPVGPAIHISNRELVMSCQSPAGRLPGKV